MSFVNLVNENLLLELAGAIFILMIAATVIVMAGVSWRWLREKYGQWKQRRQWRPDVPSYEPRNVKAGDLENFVSMNRPRRRKPGDPGHYKLNRGRRELNRRHGKFR
jgi:hypothetical protein